MKKVDTDDIKSDNLKQRLKQRTMTAKVIVILILIVAITLNVLFAWALPTREVLCVEDKISVFFTEFYSSLNFSQEHTNLFYFLLGLSFDLFISYVIYEFLLKRGDIKFFLKVVGIIAFRLFCDYYYHPKLEEESHPKSYFYSISFSKNNGNLVSHSISIAVLGFIYISKSKVYTKIFKGLVFGLMITQSLVLLLLNSRFSIQLIFSYILSHYIDLIIR
jgi:hypothetical protein